jgi:hypothetical protein
MFLTGLVWLVTDWQKGKTDSDVWQSIAAWLLAAHGGGAMATLMLLGALLPMHVVRAWRGKRNRASGAIMVTINAVLIGTSFALYYTGSEALRPWMSDIHIAAGLCLPAFLIAHIVLGRRRPSQEPARLE